MKNVKRMLGILLARVMLMGVLPLTVAAEGTRDNPIDAKTKWFGYGVNTYLLNPTIAEGTADGIWYTLTAEEDGILFLEHSYKNVDYTIYVTIGNTVYEGGCVDGVPYNRPIHTYPLAQGDVATIQIVTKDAAAGTVYASMNIIPDTAANSIKVKSADYPIFVGAGEIVYFQDDSLNAIYATQDAVLSGQSIDGVTFYNVMNTNGNLTLTAANDTDGDGKIELTLGGSEGTAGVPAVKPAWAVENTSNEDKRFTLTLVDGAHECRYDDDADADCNVCGAGREEDQPCEHVYSFDLDTTCDVCGAERDLQLPLACSGASISEDVNGLACRFDISVQGMAVYGTTAVYDNATFCGMKLVKMGAVVCNNFTETQTLPTLEDVDGKSVTNIEAKYLCALNEEKGTASFAIRIINIPDHAKDTYIAFLPYVVVEDAEGTQHTLYVSTQVYGNSYNDIFAAF